jgi:hypothetical protein
MNSSGDMITWVVPCIRSENLLIVAYDNGTHIADPANCQAHKCWVYKCWVKMAVLLRLVSGDSAVGIA